MLLPFRAPDVDENTRSMFSGAGSFGAQYAMGSKFSVFGEVGLGYSRSISPTSSIYSKTTSTTWSTRTGVGVIVYF